MFAAHLALGLTPFLTQGCQGTSTESMPPAGEPAIAFVGATVLTMQPNAEPLADMSVLVRGGRIMAMAPSSTLALPPGTREVDARGKYLLPGFVDMHCHLLSDDKIADEYADEEFAVILANGVTTIRDPIGKPGLLALREQIRSGALLGPELVVGSPQISGRKYGHVFNGVEVHDGAAASAAVRRFKLEGYDGIKLTLAITPEVFDAVVATAREVDIPVFGHVGPKVGLPRALAAGMQIEHMDQFIEMLLPDDAQKRESLSDQGIYRNWDTVELLDESRIPALVDSVVRAQVWTTPTSAFFVTAFSRGWTDADVDASVDSRFVSKAVREDLLRGRDHFEAKVQPSAAQRARYKHLRYEMLRQLHEAGGKLMVGSDAPECMLLYGFTLHRELEHMVAAGVPPQAALQAATRDPAEWLKRLDSSGTVEVGKLADLVLLSGNPLQDIRNTQAIEGVMKHGRWLDRAELDGLLDRSAAVLSQAPLRPEYPR